MLPEQWGEAAATLRGEQVGPEPPKPAVSDSTPILITKRDIYFKIIPLGALSVGFISYQIYLIGSLRHSDFLKAAMPLLELFSTRLNP